MDTTYAPPKAAFTAPVAGSDTYLPRIFDMQGRIGRIRYLVYGAVLPFLMLVAAGFVYMIAPGNSVFLFGVFLSIPIVGAFKVAQRRLHDLDKSGWWLALFFVPVLNAALGLYLFFGRGSAGPNRFGAAPEPNPKNLVLAAYAIMATYALAAILLIPVYTQFAAEVTKALETSQRSSLRMPAQDTDG